MEHPEGQSRSSCESSTPSRAVDAGNEPPAFGFWDTLQEASPAPAQDDVDETIEIRRCRKRTNRFEALADSVAAHPRPGEVLMASLAAASADLSARRLHWNHDIVPESARPGFILNVLAGALAASCPLGIAAGAAPTSGAQILLIGTPWLVAGVVIAINVHGAEKRLVGADRSGAAGVICRDCDHDLTGSRPAIPTQLLRGVDCGPKRCPECGAPWPRIPPAGPRTWSAPAGNTP